jgi:hypothetical protein
LKVRIVLILAFAIIIGSVSDVQSAWVQIGGSLNVDVNQDAEEPDITIVNGTPFVTWQEASGTSRQAYVKYFNGVAWEQIGGTLNNNSNQDSYFPKVSSNNNTPYVTCYEGNNSNQTVYVKQRNGSLWEMVASRAETEYRHEPDFTFIGTTPYLVSGISFTPPRLKRFNWDGSQWNDEGYINRNSAQNSWYPRFDDTEGNHKYITWIEWLGSELCYHVFVDKFNGSGWTQMGGGLNIDVNKNAQYPDIAVNNDTPYIVWLESDGVHNQLYAKHFTANIWKPVGAYSTSLNQNRNNDAVHPAIAILDNVPYVAWQENNGANKIYVKYYLGGWNNDNLINVNANQNAVNPSIASDSIDNVYVAWQESNGSNTQIVVKKKFCTPGPTATITPTPTITPTAIISPDGYLEHFEWPLGEIANGWSVGDNNAAIVGDGTTRGILTLYSSHSGDVLSPVMSNFNSDKYNTLEIKLVGISEDATVDVEIQDGNNSADKYVLITGLNSLQKQIVKISDMPFYWKIAVRLRINGSPGTSEVAVDYIKIYEKEWIESSATPTTTRTPVPRLTGSAQPNPFIPVLGDKTTITLNTDTLNVVYHIRIMNLKGRVVRALENENQWDGRNDKGEICEGGVYIYQLQMGGECITGKVVLLK